MVDFYEALVLILLGVALALVAGVMNHLSMKKDRYSGNPHSGIMFIAGMIVFVGLALIVGQAVYWYLY